LRLARNYIHFQIERRYHLSPEFGFYLQISLLNARLDTGNH